MSKFLFCIFIFCLLKSMTAYSCFRDPWTTPCGAPVDNCCGSVAYPTYPGSNCGCTTCDTPCCKKTTCVCETYEARPCQSGPCDCIKAAMCFPEVEYPVMTMEMRPCCYRSGWCS